MNEQTIRRGLVGDGSGAGGWGRGGRGGWGGRLGGGGGGGLAGGLGGGGADLYVSVDGDDTNPGTEAQPLASLEAARWAVRPLAGRESVTVWVGEGTYYLPRALVLTAEDSGTAEHPVVYRAVLEGRAVLSGGQRLELSWEPHRDGVWKAVTPAGLAMDQMFVEGRRQWMARFPNRADRPGLNVFDVWALEEEGRAAAGMDALAPERVRRWADPQGGYVHAMHAALWGDMHWRITGRQADGTLAMEGGWQNNRPSRMHPVFRFVENVVEELDAPGEWFHDEARGMLYYYPPAGMDLGRAVVEVVRLRHLVEVRGTRERPVRFVRWSGFTFRQAARTFMENREPLLRSDWTTYRGGAVVLAGTEDCSLEDCTFDQVGGNALFLSNYQRRFTARGLLIRDCGANGIAFVGNPEAVRSPLFRYGPQDYGKLDRTVGPRGDDYPADCLVEDCLITRTGREEKQTAPIQISMAKGITVRHCSIYEVPRAGINISEGTWGGHRIEHCDVFETVLETGDHGSFNSWGRDRYWSPDVHEVDRQVAADPSLPFLDALAPVVLHHNRWRCDHGWDVDLDDGSSGYEISHNLFLRGGLKLREGYRRRVWNNIALNNTLHPHVWFADSQDVVTNNIWMGAYRPAGGMPPGKWGRDIDRNVFTTSEADRVKFASHGCDASSVVADPGFVAPERGVSGGVVGAGARGLGFENFAMDNFGVRKPALRAMARTPVLPAGRQEFRAGGAEASGSGGFTWRGADLRALAGEEYSGHGSTRERGGLVVMGVRDGSAAARGGLRAGDLIVSLEGQPTPTAEAWQRVLKERGAVGRPLRVVCLRWQREVVLEIAGE